jgi:hypothetical protein
MDWKNLLFSFYVIFYDFSEGTEECNEIPSNIKVDLWSWNSPRMIQESLLIYHSIIIAYKNGKIWGFHNGDYEECPLLGYKHPIRTSQETYYVSVREPSR